MYNLHCHSILSDGVLLPSEIAVRYAAAGYKAIAITDHADYSNIKQAVSGVLAFTRKWPKRSSITVLSGIELTHLPPEQFKPLAAYARKQGIQVIIAHGETPAEPVIKGTNRAALLAGIDILAHPGSITAEDAGLAAQKGIFLEVTTRRGHKKTNQHVIKQALRYGAKLILNTDSHLPEDIISPRKVIANAVAAGLNRTQIALIQSQTGAFIDKVSRSKKRRRDA
ncbi:MAG: histidinol phosphate phosphatase domain-containing protein [Candidatus Omnitrophota bacterium]